MPLMPQPVNGAVDLAALKAQAQMREQLEAQREEISDQLLTQVGLRCQCGNRIRGEAVIYFVVVDALIPTQQGPQPGFNLAGFTCCSDQAIARRDGPAGRVTWLDERRAARAARAN